MTYNSHSELVLNKLWAKTISVFEHNFAMNKTVCKWAGNSFTTDKFGCAVFHVHIGYINSRLLKYSEGMRRKARSLSMGSCSLMPLWSKSIHYALNPPNSRSWPGPSNIMREGGASKISPCLWVLCVGTLKCVPTEATTAGLSPCEGKSGSSSQESEGQDDRLSWPGTVNQ